MDPKGILGSSDRPGRIAGRAGLAAAGLVAVSLIMLLAPSGLGAHASLTTTSAPYSGSVSPSMSASTTGCGKASSAPAWTFNLKNGQGRGGAETKDSECSGVFGSASSSSSYSYDGLEVAVLVHVPTSGTHQVGANLFAGWRAQGGAFDGTRSGSCSAAVTSANSTSVAYYNGASWSTTTPPGGPVLSNATYYYYSDSAYAFGYCEVESLATAYLYAWVLDSTTGATILPTSTFGTASTLVSQQTTTLNYTDWFCYNYTLWDYGTWSNLTLNCSSYNATTTTNSTDWLTNTYGRSTSFSDSGAITATVWANGTYVHSHRYYFVVDLVGEAVSYVEGWTHGSASASLNMGTNGNGFAINWIQVT